MKRAICLMISMVFCSVCFGAIVTESYLTPSGVTVQKLDDNRVVMTNAINSADGALLQNESVTTAKLDANANPENRWNEGFNDFVFNGLLAPTSADLTSTTTSGVAYVEGVRVVKDATANIYTANKDTWVDLSTNGTFTYNEVARGAAEPSTTANSIRLFEVVTDSDNVIAITDERVTTITLAAGSAVSIADTDSDTQILTEKNTDEDILRFDLGNTTLVSAREVLTIQAIDANDVKFEPTTDDDVDLGSSSKEFKDIYIDGTANIDSLVADTADINGGTIDGVTIGGSSAGIITSSTLTSTTAFISGGAITGITDLVVADGGTGASTFTDGGILLGSGTNAITVLGAASNGQIPIGDGTTDPVLATISGVASETDVTNGAGTITIGIVNPLAASKGGTGVASADPIIKGWIQMDGTGSISIKDSFNVSGIVDNGTGNYTINWDTDFANANYAAAAMAEVTGKTVVAQTITTSALTINTVSGASKADTTNICVLAIGDQ